MRFEREIEVAGDPGDVFAYLADFENTAEWDPGIESARRLTAPPTAVGSRFELVALFRGRRQRLEYVVTELDPGRRIALRGEGEKALSEDAISVSAAGAEGRTRVRFEADFRLKGLRRVAEPLIRPLLERMGDEALAELQTTLARAA